MFLGVAIYAVTSEEERQDAFLKVQVVAEEATESIRFVTSRSSDIIRNAFGSSNPNDDTDDHTDNDDCKTNHRNHSNNNNNNKNNNNSTNRATTTTTTMDLLDHEAEELEVATNMVTSTIQQQQQQQQQDPALPSVFRDDVRQDWIDAVFGKAFFATPAAPTVNIASAPSATTMSPSNAAETQNLTETGNEAADATGTLPANTPLTVPPPAVIALESRRDVVPTPPPEGRGVSGPYVSYKTTIPAGAVHQGDRVGITLSRIALGLYVRQVKPKSEAHFAGITAGSILMDINGLPMLGEPSRQALERLWQYEGHYNTSVVAETTNTNSKLNILTGNGNSNSNTSSPNKNIISRKSSSSSANGSSQPTSSSSSSSSQPIALRFYKNGQIYTAMMFSSASFTNNVQPWGISWAPCGNFALVQKVYSFAADAGARRGCLVAAITSPTSHKNIRSLDQQGAAMEIRDKFLEGTEINLIFCYPPVSSRTSYYTDENNKKLSSRNKKILHSSPDGVEIRAHPMEYGGLLYQCGIGSGCYKTNYDGNSESEAALQRSIASNIADLAARVVAGQVEAPMGKLLSGNEPLSPSQQQQQQFKSSSSTNPPGGKMVKRRPYYPKCPPLSDILYNWSTMDALIYCLQLYDANYDEDHIFQNNNDEHDDHFPSETRGVGIVSRMQWFQQRIMILDPSNPFLLQCVSVLCEDEEQVSSSSTSSNEDLSSTSPNTTTLDSKMIISLLLGMARRDADFCQRLHFVLRSYTATLEGERQRSDSNTKLLTLLHSLERLRDTQRQLSSQLATDSLVNSVHNQAAKPNIHDADPPQHMEVVARESPVSLKQTAAVSPKQTDPVMTTTPDATTASLSTTLTERELELKKHKSVFKLFRKKKGATTPGTATTTATSITTTTIATPVESNNTASLPTPPARMKKNKRRFTMPETRNSATLAKRNASLTNLTLQMDRLSISSLMENMNRFLTELDGICDSIERSLLKSISQKIADWALQPWSASKETQLIKVTEGMREGLKSIMRQGKTAIPLVNPIESNEVLLSVDSSECYILPSAHFPLLLTFHVDANKYFSVPSNDYTPFTSDERLYRTRVEVIAIRGSTEEAQTTNKKSQYFIQASLAGVVKESGKSTELDDGTSKTHGWNNEDGCLTFVTRSSWGPPQTLSLGVQATEMDDNGQEQVTFSDPKGLLYYTSEVGHCWVDLQPQWDLITTNNTNGSKANTVSCHAQIWSLENTAPFDQHGEIPDGMTPVADGLKLELKITTELIEFNDTKSGNHSRKRMLLYKHDDDLRQEMFAIQFINTCGRLLKASGLDLNLLTFRCIPVGSQRGFIEWIPGTIPLSDICQPSGMSVLGSRSPSGGSDKRNNDEDCETSRSEVAKAGLFKYQSLKNIHKSPPASTKGSGGGLQQRENTLDDNPIQDFLRSVAYDADAPYCIRRAVMTNYIKSCAGYCVLTYLLGVGDRHLDNLLLHQSGHFFHCDYSFILGNDPKKYLPMRITEDMVRGMGGRESDNYAMFLSLAGATFMALRRHENVRAMLSMVRLMAPSSLPDVSVNQDAESALRGVLDRLCLHLSNEDAILFMEQLIEDSIHSKLWMAVDAIHALGKRM